MARQTPLPSRSLPVAPTAEVAERVTARAASERARVTLVLLIGLCQGLLFLCLLPPWQHYDEPTHFEYAWLIANHNRLPHPGDEDQVLRRDIATSMFAHQFFWNLPKPALLTDDRPIEIGITELLHPPAYYALASLPLRLVRHLDVTSQLYVARSVSLLLFLLTLAVAAMLMCELMPTGHMLRWAVPLGMALLPPFADIMTSVNNDVGAVAVFSLFLWGSVRAIRLGLNWRRLVAIFGTAALAAFTKNTAAMALPLALLAVLIAIWAQRGWRWRWLAASMLGIGVVAVAVCFSWGDAAYWYRSSEAAPQASATRVATAAAPVGPYALAIEAPAGGEDRFLISPLLARDVQRLAGHTVTFGAWVWAERPGAVASLGLANKTTDMLWSSLTTHSISATTTPTFVAWTFEAPQQSILLQLMIAAKSASATADPPRVFFNGAVVVDGAYSPSTPPTFDTPAAQGGLWAGRRFTNLVRNPSGEDSWPRLRPWLDQALIKYIHRSPSQTIMALLDLQRIVVVLMPYMAQPALDGLVQSFAWGHVRLENSIWLYLARFAGLLALCGALKWAFERRARLPGALWPALIFLGVVGLLMWGNTIFRPLPLLGEMYVVPATRYTFPAMIVTALAFLGGWWALWSERYRQLATLGLIAGMVALDVVSILTIWSFYQSLPT
jgi:hypothetical protein